MLREFQNVNGEKSDLKSTFIQGSLCVVHASQRSPQMCFQDPALISLPIKVCLLIFLWGKGYIFSIRFPKAAAMPGGNVGLCCLASIIISSSSVLCKLKRKIKIFTVYAV